jgi:hypothetical protein
LGVYGASIVHVSVSKAIECDASFFVRLSVRQILKIDKYIDGWLSIQPDTKATRHAKAQGLSGAEAHTHVHLRKDSALALKQAHDGGVGLGCGDGGVGSVLVVRSKKSKNQQKINTYNNLVCIDFLLFNSKLFLFEGRAK